MLRKLHIKLKIAPGPGREGGGNEGPQRRAPSESLTQLLMIVGQAFDVLPENMVCQNQL